MEKESKKWVLKENKALEVTNSISIRGVVDMLNGKVNIDKAAIPLGHGDPSVAIAEYLSQDLPYKLSSDDVYLTVGCNNLIDVIISILASPSANILLPRPGYPMYESRAAFSNLEVRHFDLIPNKGWEVDLDSVEALADENTVTMVIINLGNPCGSVYTDQYLKKVYGYLTFGSNPFIPMGKFASVVPVLTLVTISKKWIVPGWRLGWIVTCDPNGILKKSGVYGYLTFGSNPFIPMGKFASVVPVLTLVTISKKWIVPGWRLGWIVTCDPNGILKKSEIAENIRRYLNISADPPTFIQGAIPQILEKTKDDFFAKIIKICSQAADICYDRLKEIPYITCPHKPEGSMFVMVKLNVSLLEDIDDDMEFCLKLAREESVVVLPRVAVRLKNWLRITFAIEFSTLEEGLGRIKSFYNRHMKKQ
ncbi:Aminotransferase, class I/classII [Corchorus olitorius]|uniref:Aminotransferase, class I/classII n=1 Tax=Corchorus olitorius TaxID=93759 RepID=A0A1R3JAQ1_9ROSI|nr:Aminotransferase, class I/classII [Corchorus olitorius]